MPGEISETKMVVTSGAARREPIGDQVRAFCDRLLRESGQASICAPMRPSARRAGGVRAVYGPGKAIAHGASVASRPATLPRRSTSLPRSFEPAVEQVSTACWPRAVIPTVIVGARPATSVLCLITACELSQPIVFSELHWHLPTQRAGAPQVVAASLSSARLPAPQPEEQWQPVYCSP
jgi:hypothetical protein